MNSAATQTSLCASCAPALLTVPSATKVTPVAARPSAGVLPTAETLLFEPKLVCTHALSGGMNKSEDVCTRN